MTKKLAKQLKDAGFPTPADEKGFGSPTNGGTYPHLEELIDACGDRFHQLRNNHSDDETRQVAREVFGEELNWTAFSYEHSVHADTPSEAVAKLWLALNKK